MEHEQEKEVEVEVEASGISYGANREKSVNKLEKENKMEGIDPGIAALLQNGDSNDDVLKWLIVLGFLGRDNGLFGGGGGDSATNAKLDCISENQHSAALAAVNTNMTNLFHSSEMNTQNGFNRIASKLCECCCDLKAGQKDIVNELCKQTQIVVSSGVANTQRIVDVVNTHANVETQSKLTDCKQALSNAVQTKELLTAITTACGCNDNGGHGREVKAS